MTAGKDGAQGRGWTRPRAPVVTGCALLLAGLIAGHRLVPNIRGVGSLLDSATPLLGIAVPALAVVAARRRCRTALLAVLLPAVIWGVLFGPAWLPAHSASGKAEAGGSTDLRVASQNVRATNPDPAATARALAATGADLVAMQELTEPAVETVSRTLARAYPHHTSVTTVGLWSRYPIRAVTGVDTGLGWTRALRAVVAAPDGDLVVYVVHLGSARAGWTTSRDHTMATLALALRRDHASRLVLLGDLNTASTDRVITPLTRLLRDAQADAGRGLGFTWPAPLPVTRPDHVFYRGLAATDAEVIRTPGSDHRAVIARFRPR